MAMTRLWTAHALIELPKEAGRFELVRGELVETPWSSALASSTAVEIAVHLWHHVVPLKLGVVYAANTGVVLARDPDTVLAPDGAFVLTDHLPPDEERRGFLPRAPDIVLEVLCVWDRVSRIEVKAMTYLGAGAGIVWVVDPEERTVTVSGRDRSTRVLREGDDLDGGDVLPEFRVAVAELFA